MYSGATPKTNPIWAAMAEAEATKAALLTIFPQSSISFIMERTGTGLTIPIRRPATLKWLIPVYVPIQFKGWRRRRWRISAVGRLPSITIPMEDTISMASFTGVMAGMIFKPVM